MSLKKKLRKIAKNIPFAKRFYYGFVVRMIKSIDTRIYELDKITPIKTDYSKKRLNIIVPSVNVSSVFGGISTALKMFYSLVDELNWDARIIVYNSESIEKKNVIPNGYTIVKEGEESDAKNQVVLYFNKGKGIPVGENDYFLATAWWTAYSAKNTIKWQAEIYNTEVKPLLYMIQDYEPGFYKWSEQYVLAESTYHMDIPVYALINSFELKEYLDLNNYKFDKTFAFSPVLNEKLKEYLPKDNNIVKKEKKILVYGRPTTARNAFNLVVAILTRFCEVMPNAEEWTFISAGEKHPDVHLTGTIKLKSVGKMSLEEYAKTLTTSYAGISLMVSPHPSYPPLEMSTFGVKTITNSFANRKGKTLNKNLISYANVDPDYLAEELKNICLNYNGEGEIVANNEYVNSVKTFGNVVEEVALLLK